MSGNGKSPGAVPVSARGARRLVVRPEIELLETRLTLTGNIAVTNAFIVNSSDQPLSSVSPGQQVDIQVDFTTQNLPSNASYRIEFDLNGLSFDTSYFTTGAGDSGLNSWYEYDGPVILTPGVNAVSVDVDPDESVPETTYADNSMSFTVDAAGPAVGLSPTRPLRFAPPMESAAFLTLGRRLPTVPGKRSPSSIRSTTQISSPTWTASTNR